MPDAQIRLHVAITRWMPRLQEVPGWNVWKRDGIVDAYWFDDDFHDARTMNKVFPLPHVIDGQHALIMAYYALRMSLIGLRDCEFYFRRFPFAGLPIGKHDHLRHVCEMYFGRFYEFKARLKELAKHLKPVAQEGDKIDFGKLIKLFDRDFDDELRARNQVHHHASFDDVAIDNLMFLSMGSENPMRTRNEKRRREAAYRKATREWAARVRRRSIVVEGYVEAVSMLILERCPWLSDLVPDDDPALKQTIVLGR